MFYREEIVDFIEKSYRDDVKTRDQLLAFIHKELFSHYYDKVNLYDGGSIKLPNYTEIMRCNLFKHNIINNYEKIFSKALHEQKIITPVEYEYLTLKSIDIIAEIYNEFYNSRNLEEAIFAINTDREAIIFHLRLDIVMILNILYQVNQEISKTDLGKLYYILTNPNNYLKILKMFEDINIEMILELECLPLIMKFLLHKRTRILDTKIIDAIGIESSNSDDFEISFDLLKELSFIGIKDGSLVELTLFGRDFLTHTLKNTKLQLSLNYDIEKILKTLTYSDFISEEKRRKPYGEIREEYKIIKP